MHESGTTTTRFEIEQILCCSQKEFIAAHILSRALSVVIRLRVSVHTVQLNLIAEYVTLRYIRSSYRRVNIRFKEDWREVTCCEKVKG